MKNKKYILKHWKLVDTTDDKFTLVVRVAYNHNHNHLAILEGKILNKDENIIDKKPAKLTIIKLKPMKCIIYNMSCCFERKKDV